MSDAPPPGGYPQEPQPPAGGYQPPQPPQPPQAPSYQPPTYQPPPAQPAQPMYQQPGQFQPVNPGAAKSGNGCLKAFLIVAAISFVLGVGVVVFAVFIAGSAINEVASSFGVANAADYEVTIDTCTVDDFGFVEASGTLTNKASARHAYAIDVDFTEPSKSDLKLGNSTTWTSGLNEGQSEAWSVTSSAAGDPGEVECKVSEVSYFGT